VNTDQIVLHDIHPPVELSEPFPWLLLAVCLVVIGLMIVGVVVYLRRRRRPRQATPLEIVQAELYQLQTNSGTDGVYDDSEYARKLSFALRAYIENALNIPALEMTEPEFFREFGRRFAALGMATDGLNALSRQCEQAKYGQVALSLETRNALIAHAKDILHNLQIMGGEQSVHKQSEQRVKS